MFRTLHKLYIGTGWAIALVAAAVLYQQRALFDPLVDLAGALRVHEGQEQKARGELPGRVTRVLSGDTVQLKNDYGETYRIGLAGVAAPEFQMANRAERLRAGQSKTNLSHLILSNRVRVELTFTSESRAALGIVYAGHTNINVVAVESGIVQARRDRMNGLPLKDRYALIRAERKALERGKPNDE